VGYCQGNFNGDNCAAGGFTLDYGPFGFCEAFDPEFQPWTGGGKHFSFFNQGAAAEANFYRLCTSLQVLIEGDVEALEKLNQLTQGFASEMRKQIEKMWASKLGLKEFHADLFSQLMTLMIKSKVDYTLFFRELSQLPEEMNALEKSFYEPSSQELDEQWDSWLKTWRELVTQRGDSTEVSKQMKLTNPKYTWREWLVVPAYQEAAQGEYTLVKELQEVLLNPYDEQSKEVEDKFYRLKPKEYFNAGGVSHYSCSS